MDDLRTAVRLRFAGRAGLLPLQKKNGLLVTIASTCHLVSDVTARLGLASYVTTGLLNQNPLESLFSLVRGKGDARLHPKPSEARYCVCNMLLMPMTTI